MRTIQISLIVRSMIAAGAVGIAWMVLLFSIGVNQTKTEVENYAFSHKGEIERSLAQGDIISIHTILFDLEKFGVNSSILTTPIFWNDKHREFRSGQLDQPLLSEILSIELKNNGLYLGSLKSQISLPEVLKRVVLYQWKILAAILFSNLLIFMTINYLVLSEIQVLHKRLANSLEHASVDEKFLPQSSFLSRLIFSSDFRNAIHKIMSQTKELRQLELDRSILNTEKAIARQIAHDIRSPLSALNLGLSLVSGDKEPMELLHAAVERIQTIAHELLNRGANAEIGSVRTEEIVPILKIVSGMTLVDKLKQLIAEIKIRAPGVNVTFENIYFNHNENLKTDLQILLRIVSILLNNSLEALANNHSTVKLVLESKEDSILLQVEDTGRGIPSHILARLGEKNFTFGKDNGHGLGLHYSHRATKLMKGRLEMKSVVGVGTTTTIYLPRNSETHTLSQDSPSYLTNG